MENNDRNNYGRGSTAVAFLLGALAGGITALLFAPQTGAQMRGRMKQGANDLRQRGKDLAHEAGERAGSVKGAATEARAAYRSELDKRRATPAMTSIVKEEHIDV